MLFRSEITKKIMSIYGRRRGGKLYGLNGYILCRGISSNEKLGIDSEIYIESRDRDDIMEVSIIGQVNREYQVSLYEDAVGIKEGDNIIVDRVCNLLLEYEIHRKLDERYYYVQRCNILGIVDREITKKIRSIYGRV